MHIDDVSPVADGHRPPVPPGWLGDPRGEQGTLRRRRSRSDAWQEFVEWCALRDLEPLPSTGSTFAAYLTHRAGELDELGRMAHGSGRTVGWIRKVDEVHDVAGFVRPGSTPEVAEVLLRHRFAWRQIEQGATSSPSQQLVRVLSAIDASMTGDRDTAMVLAGAVGAMSYVDLAQLTLGSVHIIPGDGVWLTLGGDEAIWLGSVDVPGLCAPCAILRWLCVFEGASPRTSEERRASANDEHLCGLLPAVAAMLPAEAPLFSRLSGDLCLGVGSLNVEDVRRIVLARFLTAGVDVADAYGVRDELMIARLLNEFTLRS